LSRSNGRTDGIGTPIAAALAGEAFYMNRFRKLGFIDYNGTLEIHSSLLNVILYDKPELLRRDQN
jgi:CRP/FNR family transcriptional regulator, cyclic AMP receptor protein